MKKSFALKALAGMTLMAAAAPSFAGLTGNINIVSSYNLRGITETYGPTYKDFDPETGQEYGPESSGPAIQGGLDYVDDSGLYVGYWFSTIDYSYANLEPADSRGDKSYRKSIEHDFYAGYNGKIGELGYTLGGTIYYYQPGWESTGYETKVGVSYGPVSVTAQTLLNDVTFGNSGDTYFLASYSQPLPKDFTFTGQLGWYIYGKDGDFNPQFPKDNDTGLVIGSAKSNAFRHLTLGISHPLPIEGATVGLQYIIGGDNRYGLNQQDTLVGSIGMTF